MATEGDLIPMEDGHGANHINDSVPPPPSPPHLPPPPPPPPLVPVECKEQPDDLLSFEDERCAEPCLDPGTPEPAPPPPGLSMTPPAPMDMPSPEGDPQPLPEVGGYVPEADLLPPGAPPPPTDRDSSPEIETAPAPGGVMMGFERDDSSAERESSPSDRESSPPERDTTPPESEPMPLPSMEDYPREYSPQEDVNYVPPNDVGFSHPDILPPPTEMERVLPERPPSPQPEPDITPYTPPAEPMPSEADPTPEEVSAPTWSDDPEPVAELPPVPMNQFAPEPEPVTQENPPEPERFVYPPHAQVSPSTESPPQFQPERPATPESQPTPQSDQHMLERAGTPEVPVDVAALAASPADTEKCGGDYVAVEVTSPVDYHKDAGYPGAAVDAPREDHVHLPPATTYVVPAQGYDVIDEEKGPVTPVEMVEERKDRGGETCCDRCLRCLSQVPCGSLVAWILLVLALGALAGSVLVGTRKVRVLLDDDTLLWFMDLTVTGVVVAMFVLGTCFLVVGHLSSEPTCRRLFNSTSKNTCARGLNMFLLGFVYVLCVCWTLAAVLLATPVVLLAMMFIVTSGYGSGQCLDLRDYGFASREVCNPDLIRFKEDAQDVLICYGVSLLAAILVVISLVHFLICLSANITHLRDNRFSTLNAYEADEDHNSKQAMLDTNM